MYEDHKWLEHMCLTLESQCVLQKLCSSVLQNNGQNIFGTDAWLKATFFDSLLTDCIKQSKCIHTSFKLLFKYTDSEHNLKQSFHFSWFGQ